MPKLWGEEIEGETNLKLEGACFSYTSLEVETISAFSESCIESISTIKIIATTWTISNKWSVYTEKHKCATLTRLPRQQ